MFPVVRGSGENVGDLPRAVGNRQVGLRRRHNGPKREKERTPGLQSGPQRYQGARYGLQVKKKKYFKLVRLRLSLTGFILYFFSFKSKKFS